MVSLGDSRKCPECNHMGRVVWISKDGLKMGIQCPGSHSQSSPKSQYGAKVNSQPKSNKNAVFLVEI